jgi:4-amino-4-deoxy-L-arabinose transferase-like glycosyltransferase
MATTTSRAASRGARALPDGASTRSWALRAEHFALAIILVLSGLLEFVKLGQNGFANIYYSAAVKSMLRSWHNFFFLASGPHGLVSVDKPPLGLWLEAASAKIFGFTPLGLLVPEGVCAVLAVALIYRIVAPRLGTLAGLASALALAVFPSFVAVSRDNGVDPMLILLMLAACGAAVAAIESGRTRTLLGCALLVGLAFNAKGLAAYLCVPGIALGYLVCAPGSVRRRLAQLVAAGIVLVVLSASWSAVVDATPASQRPFVGSTFNNSELSLEFGYNGFGRVGGQEGGPGNVTHNEVTAQFPLVRPGIDAPESGVERAYHRAHPNGAAKPVHRVPVAVPTTHGRVRSTKLVPFASTHRTPVRIFGRGLGDQAGWDVPIALIGALALLFVVRRSRRDRRAGVLLVLGGWFAVELATLDFSSGIVHPYYASALGPGLAAMVGAGAVALASLLHSERPRVAITGYVLSVLGVGGTVGAQLFLIQRYGDPLWWRIPLVLISFAALLAIPFLRRRAGWALGVAVAALLVAPMAYSFSVWLAPVNGTFPTAGPYNAAGFGGYGVRRTSAHTDRNLINYLRTHGATLPYRLLTNSSDQASPLILLGLAADAVGGYNTTDPAMSAQRLATLVAEHKARFVYIDGPYATRGSNGATNAARLVCPEVSSLVWNNGSVVGGSVLVDCAGRARYLRHPYAFARSFLPKAKRYDPRLRYTL